MNDRHQWVVAKFGGTSVSSRSSWITIAERIKQLLARGERPLIVCSASSGVSDRIQGLLEMAAKGEHERHLEALVAQHLALGAELGVDARAVLSQELDLLARLLHGVALCEEASPAIQARIMSLGEMMSTKLGAAFLATVGVDIGWTDARELLTSEPLEHAPVIKRFLSATCHFDDDPSLREKLSARNEAALLTQGFIASDSLGRTVLLGRGGSDTSAAYLAARLGASRLEIWTDVPGMFTANPRQVAHARLLKRLDYDEAQELATMGAKVLHPRCIPPARHRDIPIHLRCTPHPEMEGTVIVTESKDDRPRVKAISAKKGVTLVSMDTLGMWQQVGFLADVFAVFKSRGLSIDLVATSESNVTCTLDSAANLFISEVKDRLLMDLSQVCNASIKEGCAVVSLVGRDIRSILSRLTPAMEVFEEHKVHLVSQAASDLNISLVVDEGQADRLVRTLHVMLLGHEDEDAVLGPRWSAMNCADERKDDSLAWWRPRAAELCRLAEDGPAFVYHLPTVREQARSLDALQSVERVFYAMKANFNEHVMRTLFEEGLGIECVSTREIERAVELFGDCAGRLLFTPNFAPRAEYEAAFAAGSMVTLDNLHPMIHWPEVFRGREVLVRVDPGRGQGHHKFVRTAGERSKFGVTPEDLPELAELVSRFDVKVIGLHAHVGSGVRQTKTWSELASFLESFTDLFPSARILNLGGGLGVPERKGQSRLNLSKLDAALGKFKRAHPSLELWLEPGRFLVSEGGVLLGRVTQLKQKGAIRYVGIDTGMNSLIRPALYGAHHRIVNISRMGESGPDGFFDVVGPICESGDVLGHARRLTEPREGDVLLIANAGAYGRVMSSSYNLRPPPTELILQE